MSRKYAFLTDKETVHQGSRADWVILSHAHYDTTVQWAGWMDAPVHTVEVISGTRIMCERARAPSRRKVHYNLKYWYIEMYNSMEDLIADHFEKLL